MCEAKLIKKYNLSEKEQRRRNYDLKVIVNLHERLRNEKDFLELTFIERALLVYSLRRLKKQFYEEDFHDINAEVKKEIMILSKDMVSIDNKDVIIEKLTKTVDELNDFSNSECAKLLKENQELKAELERLKIHSERVQKICFDSCL